MPADSLRDALEHIADIGRDMAGVPVDTEAANAWAMALQRVTDEASAALSPETDQ